MTNLSVSGDHELPVSGRQRLMRAVLLTAALAATLYGVVSIDPGVGGRGNGGVALVCTVVATLGWLGLVADLGVRGHPTLLFTALTLLTVAGAVLTALRPNGPAFAFCGVGAFALAALPSIPQARALAVVAAAAVVGLVGGGLVVGQSPGAVLGTAAGLAAITLGGFNRRQFRIRLRQAERLGQQTLRTQQEQARAVALAERARAAREIHDVALAAYRAAQEALSNARKHAPDALVTVELDSRHDELVLTVTDRPPVTADRPAAPPTSLAGTSGGYGLTGLAERAELLGGALTAGPQGAGWALRLRMPT